jgi:hypothetical protein
MTERQLLFYMPVEKIDRFDILISDPHAGDDYTTIEGTANLTLQEVLDWLSAGGEWSFRVTAHGNPDKIFIRGLLGFESMRDAVAGEALMSLCTANEDEIDELEKKVRARVLNELNPGCTRKN